MKIIQIRNATILVDFGDTRILVDPMLGPRKAYPPLRLFKYRGRNPSVDLPEGAAESLQTATHCMVTHFQRGHFDHLDSAGERWIKARDLPVFCTPRDAKALGQKGISTLPLRRDTRDAQSFLNGQVRTTKCRHGDGFIGWFMEHGVGYFIEMPGEPSLLLTGDTILTQELKEFVEGHSPDVIVAPAGGARFDLGRDIIMDDQDMVALARLTTGTIVANHLGAISHCPVSREQVAQTARQAGLAGRIVAPTDGQELHF